MNQQLPMDANELIRVNAETQELLDDLLIFREIHEDMSQLAELNWVLAILWVGLSLAFLCRIEWDFAATGSLAIAAAVALGAWKASRLQYFSDRIRVASAKADALSERGDEYVDQSQKIRKSVNTARQLGKLESLAPLTTKIVSSYDANPKIGEAIDLIEKLGNVVRVAILNLRATNTLAKAEIEKYSVQAQKFEAPVVIIASLQWGYGLRLQCWLHGKGWALCAP